MSYIYRVSNVKNHNWMSGYVHVTKNVAKNMTNMLRNIPYICSL